MDQSFLLGKQIVVALADKLKQVNHRRQPVLGKMLGRFTDKIMETKSRERCDSQLNRNLIQNFTASYNFKS